MSIVTLKKKVQAQYNNSSVGQPQFSLNGTRRSSGYVGQDMLGRSLVRSLSKNGAQKGHGGHLGKYPTSQIKTTPEMSGLNNPSVVKSSSINTHGLLMSRNRWIRRPQPYSTTKPDNNFHNNIQSTYIDNLARKTIYNSNLPCNKHDYKQTQQGCLNKDLINNVNCEITKPESALGTINASDNIRMLNNQCHTNDDFKRQNNNKNMPFAC